MNSEHFEVEGIFLAYEADPGKTFWETMTTTFPEMEPWVIW